MPLKIPFLQPEHRAAFNGYTYRDMQIIQTVETIQIKKDIKDIKKDQKCQGNQITMNKIKTYVILGILTICGVGFIFNLSGVM